MSFEKNPYAAESDEEGVYVGVVETPDNEIMGASAS